MLIPTQEERRGMKAEDRGRSAGELGLCLEGGREACRARGGRPQADIGGECG